MSKMSILKSICSRKNILQGLVTIERIGNPEKTDIFDTGVFKVLTLNKLKSDKIDITPCQFL